MATRILLLVAVLATLTGCCCQRALPIFVPPKCADTLVIPPMPGDDSSLSIDVPVSSPQIVSISVTPTAAVEDDIITVRWSVSGPVTRLVLDGADVLPLGLTAAKDFKATMPWTFKLVAANACFQKQATASVDVLARPRLFTLSPRSASPGVNVSANGSGLNPLKNESAVLRFRQGAIDETVRVTAPTASRLTARIPASLQNSITAGPATVSAIIGARVSNTLTLPISRRETGAFTPIKSLIGATGDCTFDGITSSFRTVTEGGRTRVTFSKSGGFVDDSYIYLGRLGGAAFSPRCSHRVIMGLSDERELNHYAVGAGALGAANNIATIRMVDAKFNPMYSRFHVLFSPDNSIVVRSGLSSDDLVRVTAYDLKYNASLGESTCTCNSVAASVNQNGTAVVLTFDITDLSGKTSVVTKELAITTP